MSATAPKGAEDIAKLPKWAQRWIAKLERDLGRAQEQLSAGPESNTIAGSTSIDTRRPLGDGTLVTFVFGRRPDGTERDYITARLEDDGLRIAGSGSIVLAPRASNAAFVRLGEPS